MNKFGSLNIKIALLLSGVLIAFIILIYTQIIVDRIKSREAQIANLYAKSLEYIANDESANGEYSFIFNEIVTQINFPIIATDKDYKTITFVQNVDYDTTKSLTKEDTLRFFNLVKEMDEINPPIKVAYQDSIILNYVHYGQSTLVTELKLLPYVEFIIGGIFVLLGYFGFSYIKKNEQSNIWVGLSRETAHQLGTPLSSLMGWLEMLKGSKPGTEEYDETVYEIENDIDKLNKITGRFSKIGSQPKLTFENVAEVIQSVSQYFEKRIPNFITKEGRITKKVRVEVNCPENIKVKINKDLFEWVIENLLKNALDAIDKSTGLIVFNISEKEKEVFIDVSDNGKGIDKKFRKDVFRPGYSTKLRGWGLGLSLSKRIIEDYHKGKLLLIESILEQGTTFRIKLNKT